MDSKCPILLWALLFSQPLPRKHGAQGSTILITSGVFVILSPPSDTAPSQGPQKCLHSLLTQLPPACGIFTQREKRGLFSLTHHIFSQIHRVCLEFLLPTLRVRLLKFHSQDRASAAILPHGHGHRRSSCPVGRGQLKCFKYALTP